jgi:hypothetical protein
MTILNLSFCNRKKCNIIVKIPLFFFYFQGKMHAIPTPENGLATKVMSAMSDIYYGVNPHPWAIDVESWNVDPHQILEDYKQPDAMAAYN